MPKFVVIHGSVRTGQGFEAVVGVGQEVELEKSAAAELLRTGFLMEIEKFAKKKAGLEGMVASDSKLSHSDEKLAKALGIRKLEKPEEKHEEKPTHKEKK